VVHLRVDKNLSYAEVQPVLQALALAVSKKNVNSKKTMSIIGTSSN